MRYSGTSAQPGHFETISGSEFIQRLTCAVACEGGPPFNRIGGSIDALYLDSLVAEVLDAAREGRSISKRDKAVLKRWVAQAPHFFHWATTPDMRHFLLPLNAQYAQCNSPPEWWQLAAHPTAYDVGWSVPTLRMESGFGSGIIRFCGRSGDETTLFRRLVKLNVIDEKFWEQSVACATAPPAIH